MWRHICKWQRNDQRPAAGVLRTEQWIICSRQRTIMNHWRSHSTPRNYRNAFTFQASKYAGENRTSVEWVVERQTQHDWLIYWYNYTQLIQFTDLQEITLNIFNKIQTPSDLPFIFALNIHFDQQTYGFIAINLRIPDKTDFIWY